MDAPTKTAEAPVEQVLRGEPSRFHAVGAAEADSGLSAATWRFRSSAMTAIRRQDRLGDLRSRLAMIPVTPHSTSFGTRWTRSPGVT